MKALRSPGGRWPLRAALLLALCAGLVAAGTAGASSKAVAPANTAVPVVTGTAQAGSTLSASTGTWSGDLPMSFTYQWQRCDNTGANCVDIASATNPTFALTAADVGHQLRVGVTATNASGAAIAYSLTTATVTAAPVPPANTVLPTVTGSPVSGQTLTASTGTWTGDPTITFAYQWQRCDNTGANCAAIASATASTYVLTAGDVGHELRVAVTGTNGAGNATATSAATAVVTAAAGAPQNTVAPAISGTPVVGQTLSGTPGTWTGTATITFAYQWQRCDSTGANCADIAGAALSTYTLTAADVGHEIRVNVTGTNGVGSAVASSAATAVVTAAASGAPVAVFPPFITGMAFVGQALTGSTGSWTGTLPLSFAFEWQRCDQFGQGCQAIAGATTQSYTLVSDDTGHRIRLHVTATNSVGSTDAFSRTTGVVGAALTGPKGKQFCKRGGWRHFGFGFRNQGQCVSAFERGGRFIRGRGDDEGGEKGNGGSGKIGINQGLQIGGAAGAAANGNAIAGPGFGSNGHGHGGNGGGRGNGRGHDD